MPIAGAAAGYLIDRKMGGNGLSGAMMGGSLGYGGMGSGSETAAAEGAGKGVTSMESANSVNSLNGGANLLGGTSTAVGTGATTGATTGILNTSNNLQNVTGGVTGQGFSPYATTDTLGQSIAQVDMPVGLDITNAIKDPLTGQAVAPQYNSIPQVEEAPLYTGAVNPNFADIQKSSPTEIAEAQGGFEGQKPLYEKTFDSMVGFAEKNPIALATLGMTALGGFSNPNPKQVTQSAGQIAKQAYQPRQSDILKVRRA